MLLEVTSGSFMESRTPPLTADGFSYDPDMDCLSFEVKETTYGLRRRLRYNRLSADRLGEFLRKENEKPGWLKKHWLARTVDFWRAQLRHYGLPSAQKKEVCLQRVRDALGAGTLVVPERLVRLEGELRGQYLTEPRYEEERRRREKERVETERADAERMAARRAEAAAKTVPRGTFEYDDRLDCLSVRVASGGARCTTAETRMPLEQLKWDLYNPDNPLIADYPLGYWNAQSMHHGLRTASSKARCKEQLLDAARSGTLRVPEHLVELEERLRAEYLEKMRRKLTEDEWVLEEESRAKMKRLSEGYEGFYRTRIANMELKGQRRGESEGAMAAARTDDDSGTDVRGPSEEPGFEYAMTPGDDLFDSEAEAGPVLKREGTEEPSTKQEDDKASSSLIRENRKRPFPDAVRGDNGRSKTTFCTSIVGSNWWSMPVHSAEEGETAPKRRDMTRKDTG